MIYMAIKFSYDNEYSNHGNSTIYLYNGMYGMAQQIININNSKHVTVSVKQRRK